MSLLIENWEEITDQAILHAMKDLFGRWKTQILNEKRADESLTPKEREWLQRQFNRSGKSRSTLYKFLMALAEELGCLDPAASVQIAPMKSWERAAMKLRAKDRNMHDLGRSRLLIGHARRINTFDKLKRQKGKGSFLKTWSNRGVSLIPDKMDNYLKKPRKSGYAGSFNFDLEVDCGNNQEGMIEVQIMPRRMEEIYDISHTLYEIIRIVEETGSQSNSEPQRFIHNSLLIANASMWDLAANESNFLDLREKKPQKLSIEEARMALKCLNMFLEKLQSVDGRSFPPKQQALSPFEETRKLLVRKFATDKPNAVADLISSQTPILAQN